MAEVEVAKVVGNLWNDQEIDIVDIDGRFFALYGWDNELWLHCWEVKDKMGLEAVNKREYAILPIYINEDENKIIDYRLQ